MCEKERKENGTWASSGCFIFEQGGKRALAKATGTEAKDKKTKRQRMKSPRRKGEPGVRVEGGEEREKAN